MSARPGQLIRRQMLGTDAVYRVLSIEGELVEVEVVSAPGLEPGHPVRFTAAAVEQMELLPGEARQPESRAATRAVRIRPAPTD